ncbi:N-acetyldiaminopimelate deacetylase [Clostridium acetireducens DSM 10703]|uniref:N-acetyldiaminopimelate deacetylase n=1 Tax=Clostridium acetireducens DSM 10703 TaxID=1121290 RepID=A0A1E8EVS8_9CLOT|nr:M20 family metallopeptidase [Clostridium acetireducens]OFI01354.1 N-acetyldiaminopimelate deacetylase [Clostridium acetireducens DSM 10703]
MNIKKLIEENIETINKIRKQLHDNAELAFEEYKTQNIILNFFKDLHIETKILAKTGVTATLNNGNSCIALRADMDALPVNGVSHVCGHDYHMAIVLGTALILKKLNFKKCVKFIFQPAEEDVGGAIPMIKEGVLKNPNVKYMIGFHVWPNVKVGTIEVSSGASMASVDDFYITFKGKGGHAAMPHLCKNPIYPAMEFIQSMNTKCKIENNPLNPHVITFSSIQCGSVPNVISDKCKVLGTVRTFDNNIRNKIHEDILKISHLSSEKYGCAVNVEYDFQYPPLISDALLTKKFVKATKSLIGSNNVLPLEKTFAAEDFACFAQNVPSVHFRLGIADKYKGMNALHSPNFNVSDESILNGIYIITNFIFSLGC